MLRFSSAWRVWFAALLAILASFTAARAAQDAASKLPESPEPGAVRRNPADGLAYVWLPPGKFQMGCVPEDEDCDPDESPRHEVVLTQGFWIGKTEVTVAAYRHFTEATEFEMPPAPDFNPDWSMDNHPIVRVKWTEAKAFCEWAGGRLPTEAEYEYAARGGYEGLRFPWGFNISHEDANYKGVEGADRWESTAPVGSFPANRYGLHDLSGNVWEWIGDWYHSRWYPYSPKQDPTGPPDGVERVLRGGSWYTVERVLRASDRYKFVDVVVDNSVGFRCVWSPDE